MIASATHVVNRPALALLLAILLVAGIRPVLYAEDPPVQTELAELNEGECNQLYTHQLTLFKNDPDNPLYSSVRMHNELLENPETRKAEVTHCLERVSRESFACQMDAKNLTELLDCRRRFMEQTPDETGENKQPETNQESYFEQTNEPGPNTGKPEVMPSGRFAVTPANCRRAYNHIYSVISKTETFQKRPDRARLENYWQSGAARDSFAARCQARFQPRDLGCVLSTQDPDVLQGCLLVIPTG